MNDLGDGKLTIHCTGTRNRKVVAEAALSISRPVSSIVNVKVIALV